MNSSATIALLVVLILCSCSGTVSQDSAAEKPATLTVDVIGKTYEPDPASTAVYQDKYDKWGNTSVRNVDKEHLEWKRQGYFQRNRDLGQVFTAERDFVLDAIVLRTGPDDKAVLANTPGAGVYVQFFEVTGSPTINDNGTPPGTEATHGFSTNHRCDDFVDGISFKPLLVVNGGRFPQIPPTFDGDSVVNGDEGRLVFMRWKFDGMPIRFDKGKMYAFMVGFEEPGEGLGFTLANNNAAEETAAPAMADAFDTYGGGWGLRREGNGKVPPQMYPAANAPEDTILLNQLYTESLFGTGNDRYSLSPTTDGYPDVDTYRDLTFALEVSWL